MANDRIYQLPAEVAVDAEGGKGRVYQEPVEVAVGPDGAKARTYQVPVEVIGDAPNEVQLTQLPVDVAITPDDQQARLTQLPVDVAITPTDQQVRLTQLPVDVVYSIRKSRAIFEASLSFEGMVERKVAGITLELAYPIHTSASVSLALDYRVATYYVFTQAFGAGLYFVDLPLLPPIATLGRVAERVLDATGADLSFSGNREVIAGASLSLDYGIVGQAGVSLSLDYVIGAYTPVGADLDLDYGVGYPVTADLAISYPIYDLSAWVDLTIGPTFLESVGKDLEIGYVIRDGTSPRVVTSVEVDGVDITNYVHFAKSTWEMKTGLLPGTATIWVIDRDHTIDFATGKETWLTIDGMRVWGGYVMGVRRNFAFSVDDTSDPSTTPRYLVLECSDYNILFNKRFVYNKADPTLSIPKFDEGERDSSIIRRLVNNYLDLSGDGVSLSGVQYVGTPNEDDRGAPIIPATSWGETMNRIALMPGAIFYMDPYKRLHYSDVDLVDAPFKLSDTPDDVSSFGYRDVEITYDGTSLGNDALVWGAGQAFDTMTFQRYQNATSIANHGRWQWSDLRSDLYNPSSVLKRAETYVEGTTQNRRGHKDDAISITCSTIVPGLRAGMKVHFTSEVHNFIDVIPIRSMRVTFVNPNEAVYTLQLAHFIDAAWSTAEFPTNEVEICETGTPAQIGNAQSVGVRLVGMSGNCDFQTAGSGQVYWWNVLDNYGPVTLFQEYHIRDCGASATLGYTGFLINGTGPLSFSTQVSFSSVDGDPIEFHLILPESYDGTGLDSEPGSPYIPLDPTNWYPDWYDGRTNLRFVAGGVGGTFSTTGPFSTSLWVRWNRSGNDGPWGLHTPAFLAGGEHLQCYGTVVPLGGYALSRPYTPGTVRAYDAEGNLLTVTEIDPLLGTVFTTDPAVTFCYYTTDPDVYLGDGTPAVIPPPPGGSVYRPEHVRQLGWGTEFDGFNCMMASACIALDRHTEGAKTATPPQMRAEQSDQVEGTDIYDAREAWLNGWSESMSIYRNISWQGFMNVINSGRGGILPGKYSYMPSAYSCQESFDGPHAVYVNEISASGYALVYDPLCMGPKWIPVDILQDYAEAFAGGGITAGFTQVTS